MFLVDNLNYIEYFEYLPYNEIGLLNKLSKTRQNV